MRKKVKKLLIILGCIVCTATGAMAASISLHKSTQTPIIMNFSDCE